MQRIDQYQLKYHRDHVNIRESSFVSNKVYCGLRSFLNVIKQSFSDKYVTITTSGLVCFPTIKLSLTLVSNYSN